MASLLSTFSAGAQIETASWSWDEGVGGSLELRAVRALEGVGLTLAPMPGDKNVALGEVAKNDFGQRVPLTDGDIALVASEWISNTPNVFGRYFTVDLGRNRAITRVLVRPGQTALNQPEYYVRGYRIESALERDPDIWRMLAEKRTNYNLLIDTAADSTWSVLNDGRPVARMGRFVRFTITRQDRSNWVALGDIEVYAEGYEASGTAVLNWASQDKINVGQVRWVADTDESTGFSLTAKGSSDERDWAEVHTIENGGLFDGLEPVTGIDVVAELRTSEPYATPRWSRLEIDFDRRLVASRAVGSIQPNLVPRGGSSRINYSIDLEVSSDDYGVDLFVLDGLSVQLESLSIDGRALLMGTDYDFSANDERAQTVIRLMQGSIVSDSSIEVVGNALFLNETTDVGFRIGNSDQERSAGYVNWQNGQQNETGSWRIRAQGNPGDLLSSIDLSKRPYSPYEGEDLAFSFVVSNLNNPTDVVLSLYDLNGNRVRQVSQYGSARRYTLRWDGRDETHRVVDPGLYLYEVEVRGSGGENGRRGTCVVAY